jgi:1-acyl-sn-glycerol-3-phosphate acyltransferase
MQSESAIQTSRGRPAGWKRAATITWYTFSMYILTHLLVIPLLPVAALLAVFHRQTALHSLKNRLTGWLLPIAGAKVAVTGVPPAASGEHYLIVSNYPGLYVIFALWQAFPTASIVAHAFIAKIPLLGSTLAALGAVYVDPLRPLATRRALDSALKASRADLILFPEGGRTPDGGIKRFQRGFTYILRNSSLDLLPVTANGFYSLKPMKRFYADPSARLELIVHPPIRNDLLRAMTDEELIGTVQALIEAGYRP